MSAQRRARQAARTGTVPRESSRVFRVAETSLWILVAALFVARVTPQARAALGWGARGAVAPAVSFDLLAGGVLSLEHLRGQVVLVNFWATWCPPCRAEMPGIEKVYEARRGDGFTVVGVSVDEVSAQRVASFLRDHGITYPVAMATPRAVAAFGGVNDYPTSFLIDRRGRLRYTVRGMFTETALSAAVQRLLEERG